MKITPPNYFQCPNDLVDHWLPLLGEVELKCLLVIIRKTFGWHKTRDRISLSQMETLTGSGRPNIIKATDGLHSKGIILKETIGSAGKQETYYEINFMDSNKDYQYRSDTPPSFDAIPPPVSPRNPQKKQSKETLKEQQQQGAPPPAPVLPEAVVVSLEEKEKRAILEKFHFDEVSLLEILLHPKERIENAVGALSQALETQDIPNERGWLRSAIARGWKPNETAQTAAAAKEKSEAERAKALTDRKAQAEAIIDLHRNKFTYDGFSCVCSDRVITITFHSPKGIKGSHLIELANVDCITQLKFQIEKHLK